MAYKPRVKYQANAIFPLKIDDLPIVRKRISKNDYVNFANKKDLTDFIDALYNPPTSDTYMQVICCCGQEFNYTTITEVPDSKITCSCGKVIIQYS